MESPVIPSRTVPDPSKPDGRRMALVWKIIHANKRIKIHDPRMIGKSAAELHDDMGFSWPQIAQMTGLPMSTLYRRARPYLRVHERSTTEE
jgi:hypothetical protein